MFDVLMVLFLTVCFGLLTWLLVKFINSIDFDDHDDFGSGSSV